MRALGRLFPRKLTLLSTHSAPDLFFNDAGLARIVEVDMDFTRANGSLFDVPAAAAAIGAADLFLKLIPGSGSEWSKLSQLLQPRWTVAANSGPHRNEVDEMFSLPRLFEPSLRPEDFSHPFPLPTASIRFVKAIHARLGARRLLVIHGETKPHKQYPPSLFRTAVNQFLDAHPGYAAIEICRHASIFGGRPPRNTVALPGLPLASAIALAVSAGILVCVDSLFLHAADLWRTPTVSLFGPTSPEVWGPRFNPMHRCARAASMPELDPSVISNHLTTLAAGIHHYRPLESTPSPAADLVRWT
jgi:hypothetical protein